MKQSKRSSRSGSDMSSRSSLLNQSPWQTENDAKDSYLRKRKKTASAAGLSCCTCGGLIFNLSDGRRVCGDCQKQH